MEVDRRLVDAVDVDLGLAVERAAPAHDRDGAGVGLERRPSRRDRVERCIRPPLAEDRFTVDQVPVYFAIDVPSWRSVAVTVGPVAPLPRLPALSRAYSWKRVGVPNDIVRL